MLDESGQVVCELSNLLPSHSCNVNPHRKDTFYSLYKRLQDGQFFWWEHVVSVLLRIASEAYAVACCSTLIQVSMLYT